MIALQTALFSSMHLFLLPYLLFNLLTLDFNNILIVAFFSLAKFFLQLSIPCLNLLDLLALFKDQVSLHEHILILLRRKAILKSLKYMPLMLN